MGLTFKQVNPGEAAATGTSVGAAYASNATANSIMFALCYAVSTTSTLSVTDSLGNTWTQIGTNEIDISGTANLALFWAKNTHGAGANTVTFHSTVSAVLRLYICEYTGQYVGSGNPIDTMVFLAYNTTSFSNGPVSLNVTNESFLCFCRLGAGTFAISGADGTVRLSGSSSTGVLEDRAVSSAGNYTSSWTQNAGAFNGNAFSFGVKTTTSTFNITGNAGVAGATVACTGQSNATADGSGNYSFTGLSDGAVTITPTKTGYTFSPVNSAQTVAGANISAVNFTASNLAVSSVVVNSNTDVMAGTTFAVVVTLTTTVSQNTGVVLATTAGEALGGTTTGTITTGNSSVTINGCALFVAATGKVISATQTSGDAFTSGNSSAFNVLANTINRADTAAQGTPVRNVGFSVLVTATDGFDNPGNVSQDTVVALTLGAGTGVLSGTLTGTITSGTSSVTISGVVYNKAEAGVTLIATSTSGDSIGPLGVHNAFTVGGTVATPTFSPVAGSYVGTTNVTILDTDSGVTGFAMYYTTDGSTPTTGSTLYTGPISVAASETIKVLATATSMTNSAVASAAYTISAAPASGSWTQGYRNFINKR